MTVSHEDKEEGDIESHTSDEEEGEKEGGFNYSWQRPLGSTKNKGHSF
jgi:hypothetical protein